MTTKAQMATIIRNLEVQLEERNAQLAALAVPTSDESKAAIAAMLDEDCPACEGTGQHTSGGDCFRCKGKGYQDASDLARNAAYDRVRAARTTIAGTEGWATLQAIPKEVKASKRVIRIDGLWYAKD